MASCLLRMRCSAAGTEWIDDVKLITEAASSCCK